MCTSRRHFTGGLNGFTAIELLLALALAVCLAVAIAPVWLALQSAGAREADRTVQLLQGRVAIARLERDLRLAGAAGCAFALTAPILEASASQVVVLDHSEGGSTPMMVEWEISGGSLMRRTGVCPSARPSAFGHSLYVDHKTMLEEVGRGSAFSYVADGAVLTAPVAKADLASIDAVLLTVRGSGQSEREPALVSTTARVGR